VIVKELLSVENIYPSIATFVALGYSSGGDTLRSFVGLLEQMPLVNQAKATAAWYLRNVCIAVIVGLRTL
jgi:hypothetical protein